MGTAVGLRELLATTLFALLLFSPLQALSQDNTLTEAERAAGWELLFNGEDLSQWRNFKRDDLDKRWAVVDGAMTLTGKGGGDILTRKQYRNFDLRMEWNVSEAGNSGIFILVDEEGKQIYSHAPEIQILDNERHSDNKIDSHLSGSLYDMMASHPSSHRPAGQWNAVRILFQDGFIQVWQNEVQTVNITIGSSTWDTLFEASKFSGVIGALLSGFDGFAQARSGHIGLQDHSDPVAFRNVKILELD